MASGGLRKSAFVPLSLDGAITTSRCEEAIATVFSMSSAARKGMSEGIINTDVAPFVIALWMASFSASLRPTPGSATPSVPFFLANFMIFSSGETTIAPVIDRALLTAFSTSFNIARTSSRLCFGVSTALKLDFAPPKCLTGIIANMTIFSKYIYGVVYLYDGILMNPSTHTGREISYSRNVFLPITNICRNRCAYCGFRRDPNNGAWFMSPEEVRELAERAKATGCSEALLTLGERPEIHAEVKEKLEKLGYKNTVDYLVKLCRQILELGLLPHTNAGTLNESELRRLRRYNASMGLMLECAAELPVHRNSPGKDPELRLDVIEAAGKLRIPFTTGLLVGVGESFEDRVRSLLEIRGLHERYGHIQEIIIQPFDPKPNTPMANCAGPSEVELISTIAVARTLMPEMNIQVPPNLVSNVGPFLLAGANDLGGVSSVTPDFINPEKPWPTIKEIEATIKNTGFCPRERLPIYPRYALDKSFMSKEVHDCVSELADADGYRRRN